MSGFKAKGDIATLIGAPRGYQVALHPPLILVVVPI